MTDVRIPPMRGVGYSAWNPAPTWSYRLDTPVARPRRRGVPRWVRVLFVLVAATVLGTLIAAHSSETPSYAAQDQTFAAQESQLLAFQHQEAVLATQIAAARRDLAGARARAAAARRFFAAQRREAVTLAAMEQRATHGLQVLRSYGFTPDSLCTPANVGAMSSQQRQALNYFNLSCNRFASRKP